VSTVEQVELSPEPQRTTNPFKFLDYYDENDRDIFTGRGEELHEILASFSIGTTFVLYGRSGLGKTSLLRAGLFQRMREDGYVPIYIRILDDPVADLTTAVKSALGSPRLTPRDLPAALAGGSEADACTHVVVLDQFEECFIRFEDCPDVRNELARVLGEIAAFPGTSVRLFFSLREDYLANLDDLSPFLPDLRRHSYRLMPLTGYGARQAILTALSADPPVPFEPGVVTELVKRLETTSFNPLMLQIFCTKVFERALQRDPANLRITIRDVEEVGRVDDIFRAALQNVMEELSDNDQKLLICCILDILKTSDNTKRAIHTDEVACDAHRSSQLDIYFNATREQTAWALEYLRERHFVRRLPTREGWYELLHDSIARVIDEWLRENELFRKFRDTSRVIDNLMAVDNNLADSQIRKIIDPCRTLLRLSRKEVEFIFRSALQEQSESIPYWASRFDQVVRPGAAVERIVTTFETPEHRRAAAVAARRPRSPELAAACRTAALTDDRPEVQRCAGAALAALEGELDLEPIREALKNGKSRANAIALLADLEAGGRDLSSLKGIFVRARVHRILRQRSLRESVELLANRAATATTFGAVAGALWYLLVVVPSLYIFWSAFSPRYVMGNWEWLPSTSGVIPAAILGAWMGRRATTQITDDNILKRRTAWLRPLSWDVEILSFFLALFGSIVLEEMWPPLNGNEAPPHRLLYLIPAALILAFALLVGRWRWRGRKTANFALPWWVPSAVIAASCGVLYLLAWRFKWEDLPVASPVGAVLAAAVLPFALTVVRRCRISNTSGAVAAPIVAGYAFGAAPALLLTLVITGKLSLISTSKLTIALVEGLMTFLALLSMRTTVSSFSLMWCERLHPLASGAEALKKQSALAIRTLLAAFIIACLAVFAVSLGPYSMPFWPQPITFDQRLTVSPSRYGNTRYLKLAPKSSVLTFARFESNIENSGFPATVLTKSGGLSSDGVLGISPNAAAVLSIHLVTSTSPCQFWFQRLAVTDGDVTSALAAGDSAAVVKARAVFDNNGTATVSMRGHATPSFKLYALPIAFKAPDERQLRPIVGGTLSGPSSMARVNGLWGQETAVKPDGTWQWPVEKFEGPKSVEGDIYHVVVGYQPVIQKKETEIAWPPPQPKPLPPSVR